VLVVFTFKVVRPTQLWLLQQLLLLMLVALDILMVVHQVTDLLVVLVTELAPTMTQVVVAAVLAALVLLITRQHERAAMAVQGSTALALAVVAMVRTGMEHHQGMVQRTLVKEQAVAARLAVQVMHNSSIGVRKWHTLQK
jgi:hypothetical protein